MKKPNFWNSLAIYLLLYNNILLIIALIIALLALIDGTSHFDSAVGYQIIVFLIYILVISGLIVGGKRGYWIALLFVPFILFEYFYPPMMNSILPKSLPTVFRLIELFSILYLLISPSSRHYIKEQKSTRN